jgi:hypothetical protein
MDRCTIGAWLKRWGEVPQAFKHAHAMERRVVKTRRRATRHARVAARREDSPS